ncbi:hypothetical protein CAAN1_01S03070 [[Candida] anglica]|uniref:Lipid droplet-associated perilipin protein n=1 Tax=[Candida] anglica TaxID=148631 RepID=A0ABP0EKY3_9ASCO
MSYTKSVNHIASYPPVSSLVTYALSFQLINYVYQQFISLYAVADKKAVTPYFGDLLTTVDTKFDSLVLGNVDTYVAPHLPVIASISDLNPITFTSKNVLAPVNTIVYDTADKYLPATVTENKPVFKLSELTETSELSKSVAIGKEISSRLTTLVTSKSSEISSHLTTTYNEELEQLSDKASKEVNNVQKHVSASYSTSLKLAQDLNKSYIQPLKTQTQDYVVDVATTTKNKADALISEAKHGISNGISTINNKGEEIANSVSSGSSAIPVN